MIELSHDRPARQALDKSYPCPHLSTSACITAIAGAKNMEAQGWMQSRIVNLMTSVIRFYSKIMNAGEGFGK